MLGEALKTPARLYDGPVQRFQWVYFRNGPEVESTRDKDIPIVLYLALGRNVSTFGTTNAKDDPNGPMVD